MSNTANRRAVAERANWFAVVSTDPISFVVALLLFCTAAIVLAIYVHSQVTGFQPKESWTEVSVGVGLIATVFLAVISYRIRSINSLLTNGIRQTVRIDRFLAVGIWVIVQIEYDRHGIQSECRLWLANSRRSRKLRDVSEITLAMERTNSSHFVITDLFS